MSYLKYLRITAVMQTDAAAVREWRRVMGWNDTKLEPVQPGLLTHTVYSCANDTVTHNVACPVCMRAQAVFYEDPTKLTSSCRTFLPCVSCQQTGWVTVRMNPRLYRLLQRLGLLSMES